MAYNIENAKKVTQALAAAGAPVTILPFLLAQVAHETGNFDSRVFRDNNNASGIMFINNPTRQKNATRGRLFPANEQPRDAAKPRLHYANFATLKDWAVDYLRIIGKTPQTAQNLTQYATLLKNRGYYTAPLASYARALNVHYTNLKKAGLFNNLAAGSANILPLIIGAGLLFLFIR
jgi:hypothetical protein